MKITVNQGFYLYLCLYSRRCNIPGIKVRTVAYGWWNGWGQAILLSLSGYPIIFI